MTERVLAVVAHPDDESLGCGATLAKHAAAGDAISIVALADGVAARGNATATFKERHGQFRAACKILGTEDVWIHQYRDNQMDGVTLLHVVKQIETHVARFKPTLVYTHWHGDLNIDHQRTSRAVLTACRPLPKADVKRILMFEVPSSTEWGAGFEPNWFENATDTLPKKLAALECYTGEMPPSPHPRSPDAVIHLASWRGATAGLFAAEAFMLARNVS